MRHFHFPLSLQSPLCLWDGCGCGSGTRTHDQRLMRPVSYRCSIPQYEDGSKNETDAGTYLCKLPAVFCALADRVGLEPTTS